MPITARPYPPLKHWSQHFAKLRFEIENGAGFGWFGFERRFPNFGRLSALHPNRRLKADNNWLPHFMANARVCAVRSLAGAPVLNI